MLVRCAIFLGQSNAMNYSTGNPVPISYPGGWTPDANFKIWGNGAFETYNPGANYANVGFWGPEAGYIAAYKANRCPQVPLFIIKHSVGSCGLAKKAGTECDFNPYSNGKQFDASYNKIVAGLNAMQTSGEKAIVPAIFMVNGETDSLLETDARAYFNNLVDFAEGLRGRIVIHNAKVIIARIQDEDPNGHWRCIVRDAQDRFGCGFKQATVDIDDLYPLCPNNHLTPANVVTLGERFYEAEQEII